MPAPATITTLAATPATANARFRRERTCGRRGSSSRVVPSTGSMDAAFDPLEGLMKSQPDPRGQ